MKRVLILVNHDVVIYNFRRELVEELINQGFSVYLSCPYGERIELLKEMGCKYLPISISRRSINPLVDLKLFLEYVSLFRKIKPDVVLAYTIKPNIYGGIIARLFNTPCLNNITGLGSTFLKDNILRRFLIFLYRLALGKSQCVFFQNKDNLDLALKIRIVRQEKARLIPGSGVNLEYFQISEYPSDINGLVFNFIGRIMAEKGINEYLEAAKVIKESFPFTTFNVIGFIEPTETEYKKLLGDYENQGVIRYLGFMADVRPVVQFSHCTIHPSKYGEGMSNVLLESAAMGRPLIASNIPGCKEIIDDGVNGFLFEEGNVEQLISCINKFVQNSHNEKRLMGALGREKVENEFDRRIVVNAYMEVISNLNKWIN